MVTWHLRYVHSWAKLLYKWNMLPSFKSVSAETEQTLGWHVLKYMFGDSLSPESFSGVLKQWTYHQLSVKYAGKLIPCI
jgi:hypothetical protein